MPDRPPYAQLRYTHSAMPDEKAVEVLIDGVVVAWLPHTRVRYERTAQSLPHLTVEVIADNVSIEGRQV